MNQQLIYIGIIGIVAVTAAIIVIRKKLIEFDKKLYLFHLPHLTTASSIAGQVGREIDKYNKYNGLAGKVEDNIKGLKFPVPDNPGSYDDAESIMKKFSKLLDDKSMLFSASEQFVFAVFPPDQIAECLVFATENILDHSSHATVEILNSVKSSIVNGLVNSNDPEILLECLRRFSLAVINQFNTVGSVESIIRAVEHGDVHVIASTFINLNTVVEGFDPAMNIYQHAGEIYSSAINHSADSVSDIASHSVATLHIEPGAHFPYVTLVLSGVREFRLLENGKTAIEDSIKNIALDVAGSGLGALGGAKAGALTGSLFGPVGTLIGGIVGAIGGAVAGRAATNKVKRVNLDAAIDRYQSLFSSMRAAVNTAARKCVSNSRTFAITEQETYMKNIGEAPRFSEDKKELAAISKSLHQSFANDIAKHRKALRAFKRSLFSNLPKYSRKIKRIESELLALENSMPSLAAIQKDPDQSLQKQFAAKHFLQGEFQSTIAGMPRVLNQLNADIRKALLMWSSNSHSYYNTAIANVAREFNTQAGEYQSEVRSWKGRVDRSAGDVRTEREKLGL